MELRDHYRRFLQAQIELLRETCADAGVRLKGDPCLSRDPKCDLCPAAPEAGRLLVGRYCLEIVGHGDGRVSFRRFRVAHAAHGQYWVCMICYRMLATAPRALLLRLARLHGYDIGN